MENQSNQEPVAEPVQEGVVATAVVDKPGDAATHFIFTHKLFEIANCKFALNGADKMPCFYVPFDNTQVAAIELRKIQTEFNIPSDSIDAALLKKVEKGLGYVREIRPNDSIPREILDGSASWSVEQSHKDAAICKLNQEMIFWISGFRGEFPPLAEMQRAHKEQEARNQMRDAHKKIAQLLGLPDSKVSVQRLNDLAREYCYIEALRERSQELGKIGQKLSTFATSFKKEPAFATEIARMQDLLRRAVKLFADKFAKVDGSFKDVLKAINNSQATIEIIREGRDFIHMELKKWDDYFPVWDAMKIERSDEAEKAFRAFYRFLAENYMEQQSWNSSTGQKK
jgi:hypothetical protein